MKSKIEQLKAKGFYEVPTTSQYEVLRLKGPCNVILYSTGKFSVQGKEDVVQKIKQELGLEVPKKVEKQSSLFFHSKLKVIVGSDETLKGDTFGGLIVAGFRANPSEQLVLKDFGVDDSKKFSDKQIKIMAKKIRDKFPKNYSIFTLNPKEYNDKIKSCNVTVLLNSLHHQVNQKLKTKSSMHVVDKYPGCNVGDIIETKAESKYVAVAAASIIAREEAIKQFIELSKNVGFNIPKGSTHVSFALKKLVEKKIDFKDFVKMNFSNVQFFLK
ncbi:MAG: hypothetical protein ABIC91_02005 [Nanoarchaeota archaeon]|nr:hypothetical protein [Nanoarchaeota archaeon]MBU1030657.1 hypothetical protein [Nanoarchaeota archaeon]MBU1850316.1 hypothetical protein [Nanoarchaeota archaeon]